MVFQQKCVTIEKQGSPNLLLNDENMTHRDKSAKWKKPNERFFKLKLWWIISLGYSGLAKLSFATLTAFSFQLFQEDLSLFHIRSWVMDYFLWIDNDYKLGSAKFDC